VNVIRIVLHDEVPLNGGCAKKDITTDSDDVQNCVRAAGRQLEGAFGSGTRQGRGVYEGLGWSGTTEMSKVVPT
jgi:hypothetical protein